MQVPPIGSPMTPPPAVCEAWFGSTPVVCMPLVSGGFGGSPTFEVRGDAGRFVLKRFPSGFPPERAAWVHDLMCHLRQAGIAQVPTVVPSQAGATVVTGVDGGAWELVAFLSGRPVTSPSPRQAAAGLEALARLHRAAAVLPGEPPREGLSPGHLARIDQARRLLERPWHHRVAAPCPAEEMMPFRRRLEAAVERFESAGGHRAVELVARSRPRPLQLQAVLRDVWSEHLLYAFPGAEGLRRGEEDRLVGIVDYHAAGVDTPATDVARLLGSWRFAAVDGPHASEGPAAAVAAYEAVRPLSADERVLVPFLRGTSVVFGLDNWFRWTLEEGRRFASPERVCARIDSLSERLATAIDETIIAAANLD